MNQMEQCTTEQWANDLLGGARLGDKRRVDSAVAVLGAIARKAGQSLPEMADGDSAMYERIARYCRNDSLPPLELVRAGCDSIAESLASEGDDILIVDDTTTLSYKHASISDEVGELGGPKGQRGLGLFVHSAIAVSANTGDVLGLMDQMYAARQKGSRGLRYERSNRLYEEKESFKWEASFRTCWERCFAVNKQLIFVSDREADIQAYILALDDEDARFIVRSAQDRALHGENIRLVECLSNQPEVGYLEVHVAQRGGRKARQARLVARSRGVTLAPPKNALESLRPVQVNAVVLTEVDPPDNVDPIHWTLLTSEPVATIEEVAYVVGCYALRWTIEEFHRCWKSDGTNVERLRQQSLDNILRVAILMAFVAVRLMNLRDDFLHDKYLRHLPRVAGCPPVDPPQQPEKPCTKSLSPLEWKVLWLRCNVDSPPPETPPTMNWAMRQVARLGGWQDSKRTGIPGYKTLWRGWHRLQEFVEGIQLARQLQDTGEALDEK